MRRTASDLKIKLSRYSGGRRIVRDRVGLTITFTVIAGITTVDGIIIERIWLTRLQGSQGDQGLSSPPLQLFLEHVSTRSIAEWRVPGVRSTHGGTPQRFT